MGLAWRIRSRMELPVWLPAVAQGAIGIECRAEDGPTRALVAALAHAPTTTCVAAERAMNRVLQGSCDVPIAGFAQLDGDSIVLHGMVGDAATGELLRAERRGAASSPEALGQELGAELIANGANRLLRR